MYGVSAPLNTLGSTLFSVRVLVIDTLVKASSSYEMHSAVIDLSDDVFIKICIHCDFHQQMTDKLRIDGLTILQLE